MSRKSKQKFRSGFEKRVGEANPLAIHEPSEPRINYTITKRYIPDFVLANGIVVEVKGYFTSEDRTKMLLVKKQNPNLHIKFLFQRANNHLTKSKNSRTYWQWCEDNNFEWAEGTTIPQEWYDNEG